MCHFKRKNEFFNAFSPKSCFCPRGVDRYFADLLSGLTFKYPPFPRRPRKSYYRQGILELARQQAARGRHAAPEFARQDYHLALPAIAALGKVPAIAAFGKVPAIAAFRVRGFESGMDTGGEFIFR